MAALLQYNFKPLSLDAGQLATGQWLEGPVTDHLSTGFAWFPCVYKRMLRWFPNLQDVTAATGCQPNRSKMK